ncbi:MAG: hypothetical protein KAI35_03250 [Desulfobulbaceae bacterium]|nr:hypothetical protein [Desulfobulbaceae bacterium]
MFTKIISGGQTGADQAGLDAAIKLGIPHMMLLMKLLKLSMKSQFKL